ncbi:MAG: hypothetical protein R3B67_13770 [Phycisphaerales bacterium]
MLIHLSAIMLAGCWCLSAEASRSAGLASGALDHQSAALIDDSRVLGGTEWTSTDGEELKRSIRMRVRSQLRKLPEGQRPIERETEALSKVVADYFMFQREATLEDLLKRYEDRGIDPRPELVQADRERATRAWLKAAGWARNEEVQVDTIEMLTVFLRGRLVGQLRSGGGPINSRRMSTGQFLLEDSAGFTVYEMRVKSTVQVRLGGSELDATVSVLFINDGSHGEWSAISSAFLDVPPATRILPPYP